MEKEKRLAQQRLLIEMEHIHDRGVMILLDNVACTPQDITDILTLGEEGSYMRDYVIDEEGVWTQLRFDRIKT